jgi:acyl-CoA reductase-like NAD-dependent aldehyde dehydrogenase
VTSFIKSVATETETFPEERLPNPSGVISVLSIYIYGEESFGAMKRAERLETGMCHINGATVHDEPQMRFGGVKASGWGRFGGRAALEEFTELRWITIRRTPNPYPI